MRNELLLGLGFVLGCHHSGTGQGVLETPASQGQTQDAGPVTFNWDSKGDVTEGNIQAALPDGTEFNGTYLQVTNQATSMEYGPYYGTWNDPMWGAAWYSGPESGFVTEYTGRVIAHLRAQNGTRMRCKFNLREPISGMSGGGQGDCQLSSNETIFDARLNRGK